MTDRWTTSFLAALGPDAFDFMPQPQSFADTTVVQHVRLRRGGEVLRVELSNEFGEQGLALDEVTVGGVPATLAGAEHWIVPPGVVALSDPVARPTSAGELLPVAVTVSTPTGAGSYLHSAQQTGTTGDLAFDSLFWISRVLTDAPAAGPVVVAFGDSITRGDGTTVDADQRYPDHLQGRLGDGAVVLNAGIGGNRVLAPGVGPAMVDRFDRDVLALAPTHVIILGGTNDIGQDDGSLTAAALAEALLGLAERASAAGVRPLLGTILPFAGAAYPDLLEPGKAELRAALNAALTAGPHPVVDFAAALADPADPSRLPEGLHIGDGVHPDDTGAAALAAAVDLALLSAPANTV